MAGTEVAHAYVTLLPKLDKSFKTTAQQATEEFGSSFKNGLSAIGVAAGQLLANAIQSTIGNIGQLISEGVGYADALTRFPLVLESLGVAGEEATLSIEKLNDGLRGTPILTSDATTAVQRLVATTGDVQKSTDWFIALNDAVMAGGAPFQVQQAALEQWQQAVAKGKPDRIEFRSFMQAFPGVMKQVAQELGVTTAEMQTMFSKGELSMEEFNSVLLKLDTEGTAGFKNLKEQARQALVGIDTGFALVRKGLIEGFGNIFQTLNISKQMGLFQDLGDSIKQSLINMAEPAAIQMSSFFSVAFDNIRKGLEGTKEVTEQVGAFIGKIFKNLRIGGFEAIGNLAGPFIELGKVALSVIGQIILKFTEFAANNTELFKVIGQVAAAFSGLLIAKNVFSLLSTSVLSLGKSFLNPTTIILSSIALLAAGFFHLYNTSEDFRNMINKLGNDISQALAPVAPVFKEALIVASRSIAEFIESIMPLLNDVFMRIAETFAAIMPSVTSLLIQLIPVIQQIFNLGLALATMTINLLSAIIPPLMQIAEIVIPLIANVIASLIPVITPILNLITNIINVVGGALMQILPQLITSIAQIAEVVAPIIQNIADILGRVLPPIINILGAILIPILQGLVDFLGFVASAIGLVVEIIAYFCTASQELGAAITDFILGIRDNIGQWFSDIGNWFTNLPGMIWNAISDIGTWLIDAGRNLIQGLIDGIVSMAGKIWDAIKNVCGGAIDFVKGIFGIHSPSKVFAKLGAQTMQGYAVGLLEGLNYIETSMKKATNTITSGFSTFNPTITSTYNYVPISAYSGLGKNNISQQPIIINFNNARLNDDKEMRETAMSLAKMVRRKERM